MALSTAEISRRYRERNREKWLANNRESARRRIARNHAAGLTSDGKPRRKVIWKSGQHPAMRALERVQIGDGCWLYPVKKGRPYLLVEGRNVAAYTVVYEALVGPVPDGLVLDHLCRQPTCINVDHLEPVTPAENTRRMSMHRWHGADATNGG